MAPRRPIPALVAIDEVEFIEPAWTAREAAAFLGITVRQLRRLNLPRMRVGHRSVRYRPEVIRTFARKVQHGVD